LGDVCGVSGGGGDADVLLAGVLVPLVGVVLGDDGRQLGADLIGPGGVGDGAIPGRGGDASGVA
jgi:hypothetical protein